MKQKMFILFFLFLFLSCDNFIFNNPIDTININYEKPDITVSKGNYKSIHIKWTVNQKNSIEYILYRGKEKSKLSELIRIPGNQYDYEDSSPELEEGKTYFYAVKAVLAPGEITALSNIAEGWYYLISFTDPNLENVVRTAINKPAGEIYPGNIARLTELNAGGKNIINLSGIEYLTSLTTLNLSNNNLTDINALSSLTKLITLDLYDNNITDINALSSLTELQYLSLSDNTINTIDSLSLLRSLKRLYLDDNNLCDINALSTLTKLEVLYIDKNNISDIKALSSLQSLTIMMCGKNNISDISALVNNEGLADKDYIYLWENPLSEEAKVIQIPALIARGVTVYFE